MTTTLDKLRAASPKVEQHTFRYGPLAGETFFVKQMTPRVHGEWLKALIGKSEAEAVALGSLLRVALCLCDESGKAIVDPTQDAELEVLRSTDYQIISQIEMAVLGNHEQLLVGSTEAKKN